MHCGTISSGLCQSAATSEIVLHCWSQVEEAWLHFRPRTDLYLVYPFRCLIRRHNYGTVASDTELSCCGGQTKLPVCLSSLPMCRQTFHFHRRHQSHGCRLRFTAVASAVCAGEWIAHTCCVSEMIKRIQTAETSSLSCSFILSEVDARNDYVFHKSFPPQSAGTHRTGSLDLSCSTVLYFFLFCLLFSGRAINPTGFSSSFRAHINIALSSSSSSSSSSVAATATATSQKGYAVDAYISLGQGKSTAHAVIL